MIKISQLNIRFGDFKAVDGLSLDIPQGELFGFLGPNGAGKTTTIRAWNGALMMAMCNSNPNAFYRLI